MISPPFPRAFSRPLQIATLLTLTAFGSPAAQELLPNGDVSVEQDGKPGSWWKAAEAIQNTAVGTQDARESGDKDRGTALYIKYGGGEGRMEWYQPFTREKLPIEPGKKYRLSVWFKCEMQGEPIKGKGGYVKVRLAGVEDRSIFLTPMGNYSHPVFTWQAEKCGWTRMECVFLAPDDMATFGITFAADNHPGEYWADDFRLEPVDDATAEGLFHN